MNFQKDHATGLLIRGNEIVIDENQITEPDIQIPIHLHDTISRIHGRTGQITPALKRRPAGLRLFMVDTPENLREMPSMEMNGKTIVYSPRDYDWLGANQCFVVCDLNAEEMAYGKQLSSFASLKEMMTSLRKPRLWFGHQLQVDVHARILRPVLEMTLILLGLPLVISKPDRNIITSAGLCLLVVTAVQLTVVACNGLGAYSLIRPAALAAWIPIMIFIPLAVLSMRRLKT
jgi:lipopolysaccharide export system permease protein